MDRGAGACDFRDWSRLIGARLRWLRMKAGYSQAALGEVAGVTFQQVQKYERGANRIGAPMLYAFACALGVSVSDFFVDLGDGGSVECSVASSSDRQMLELCRVFRRIPGRAGRHHVIETARRLAGE